MAADAGGASSKVRRSQSITGVVDRLPHSNTMASDYQDRHEDKAMDMDELQADQCDHCSGQGGHDRHDLAGTRKQVKRGLQSASTGTSAAAATAANHHHHNHHQHGCNRHLHDDPSSSAVDRLMISGGGGGGVSRRPRSPIHPIYRLRPRCIGRSASALTGESFNCACNSDDISVGGSGIGSSNSLDRDHGDLHQCLALNIFPDLGERITISGDRGLIEEVFPEASVVLMDSRSGVAWNQDAKYVIRFPLNGYCKLNSLQTISRLLNNHFTILASNGGGVEGQQFSEYLFARKCATLLQQQQQQRQQHQQQHQHQQP